MRSTIARWAPLLASLGSILVAVALDELRVGQPWIALFLVGGLVLLVLGARNARPDGRQQAAREPAPEPWITADDGSSLDLERVDTDGYGGARFGKKTRVRGRDWRHRR